MTQPFLYLDRRSFLDGGGGVFRGWAAQRGDNGSGGDLEKAISAILRLETAKLCNACYWWSILVYTG